MILTTLVSLSIAHCIQAEAFIQIPPVARGMPSEQDILVGARAVVPPLSRASHCFIHAALLALATAHALDRNVLPSCSSRYAAARSRCC